MKAIVGLGNPGSRYRYSRHNLGFLVVEKLAKVNRIKITQEAFNCLLGKGRIGQQQLLLGLPLTLMNLSAEAVLPIVKRKKIRLADLLIILDDVNLPLGKIRIRAKGSDGGHRGLRSIIEALGSESFSRLRIGTGPAKTKGLRNYVLGRFKKSQIKVIQETVEEAVRCCEVWATKGVAAAMNKFN